MPASIENLIDVILKIEKDVEDLQTIVKIQDERIEHLEKDAEKNAIIMISQDMALRKLQRGPLICR